MMQFLEWTFASGWRFLGVAVLILLVFAGLTDVARAIRAGK